MTKIKADKFDPLNCSIAHVLDIIGEGWSILIIREAFFGTRRFEDFLSQLGIARNILTSRLKKLCHNEILDRVPIKPGAKRQEYVLTQKGKDLMPLLIALTQWGDKWIYDQDQHPVIFEDKINNQPIQKIRVFSSTGDHLRPRDIMLTAGPGASDEARQRLQELAVLVREQETSVSTDDKI